MTSFEHALEDCLDRLAGGQSTVEQCLERYPEHAARLGPQLRAAGWMRAELAAEASTAVRSRVLARLERHMQEHPRRRSRRADAFRVPRLASARMASALAGLALAVLSVGTAAAQAALPGDGLYPWKRASEEVWRGLHPDDSRADLALLERRADEVAETAGDPARRAMALDAFRAQLERALQHDDQRYREEIEQMLRRVGAALPDVDLDELPGLDQPELVPTTLPEALETPLAPLETPLELTEIIEDGP